MVVHHIILIQLNGQMRTDRPFPTMMDMLRDEAQPGTIFSPQIVNKKQTSE